MKKYLVVMLVLSVLFGMYSIAEATGKLVTTRLSDDGWVTTKPCRLISSDFSPGVPSGYLEINDGYSTKKFYSEHNTARIGPYNQLDAPIFPNGIYADFYAPNGTDSHGVATFTYIELE